MYFRHGLSRPKESMAHIMSRVLGNSFVNPPMRNEPDGQAMKILRGYAVGRLLVPWDNRFFFGDPLELLQLLIAPRVFQMPGERDFCDRVLGDFFAEDSYTLLLNPHISRNEELQLSVYPGGVDAVRLPLGISI